MDRNLQHVVSEAAAEIDRFLADKVADRGHAPT
jgi:hypothetical protein